MLKCNVFSFHFPHFSAPLIPHRLAISASSKCELRAANRQPQSFTPRICDKASALAQAREVIMQGPPTGGPHHPPFPGAGGGAFPAGNRPGMPVGQQAIARTQEQEDAIIEEKVRSCKSASTDPLID